MPGNDDSGNVTFEERLARLDAIAAALESDLPLARALELFEEGVETLRAAATELGEAETRVERLVEQPDGSFVVEPRD